MTYPVLPEEIISLICADLGRQGEFGALYNCARSAKLVADSALRTMYRYHELSPAFNYTEDDVRLKDGTYEDSPEYFLSWSKLWRSIICSCVEPMPTYKPYSRYIRVLDFRNFSDMLESTHFRFAQRSFFARPLASFQHNRTLRIHKVPDTIATINHVGETIVPKCVHLEEVSGQLSPGFLTRWISRTPQLRRMVLWDGNALRDGAGAAIAANCENFAALSILNWAADDADDIFSTFLRDLKQDSIQYLQFISRNEIARKSFEALGCHAGLRKLKLANLCQNAMENLNGLNGCAELEVLSLEDSLGSIRLEALHNDVFVDVIAWLSSCKKLRDITLKRFVDGPAILAAVAIAPEVKWTKLSLEGYTVRNASSASFHAALTEQKELDELFLSGNGDDTFPQDLEIMVSSICTLSKLTKLTLRTVSDEFEMTHITNLALSLPLLQEFSTSGQELTSDILPLLANMRNLRVLILFALTQFDFDAVFDFVCLLDANTQKGFSLSLMSVDVEFALSEEKQKVISDTIADRVGGSFEHVAWREALESENEDSD